MMLGVRKAIKVWLAGGLTGLGTGLSFILVHDALTPDLMFDLWEFGVALAAPFIVAIVVALVTKSRIATTLVVAYLTLLIPVLGPAFGASGAEPLWQFAVLGLVGGVCWSTPFALWKLARREDRGRV
jgi:FtsH-binding integral membrane protein